MIYQYQALLIAGGRSSRMGRDKAFITNKAGVPLYLLQRQLLLSLQQPPVRVLLSGRGGVIYDWPAADILLDSVPASESGPLAAIEALARFDATPRFSHSPRPPTLVLAVDLPCMSADYLHDLLRSTMLSTGPLGEGVVATTDGRLEPLVALYPPAVVDLACTRFHQGVRAVHHVLEEAIRQGLMQSKEVPVRYRSCFTNLTTEADIKRWHEAA